MFLSRLRVSCSYSISSNAFPVNVQVFTLPPPHPETHPGPLTLELKIAKGKTLLAGASGLQSKALSLFWALREQLGNKILARGFYVYMLSLQHLEVPNSGVIASTPFGLLQISTMAPTTLLVTTQW